MSDIRSIYRATGKEEDLSTYGLDLYWQCSHGCKYCFADWNKPERKMFALANIDAELKRMVINADDRLVTLSFIGDIYDRGMEDTTVTRQVLQLFRKYEHPFQVLTKGGTIAASDFDLYGPRDRFGVTLTFDNPEDSHAWEPGAALPEDRIEALRLAHERGIKTWVSLEPVIKPEQTLHLIELTAPFVDFYLVGMLNHHPELGKDISWRSFRKAAKATLGRLGKSYKIKKELEVI